MPFFIDTSALFKRYQPEQGTNLICQILENVNERLFISSISVIEVISNLKRLFEIEEHEEEHEGHFPYFLLKIYCLQKTGRCTILLRNGYFSTGGYSIEIFMKG